VMAHLFSLSLVRDIFARHVNQGSGPEGFTPPAGGATAQNGGGSGNSGSAPAQA